MERGNFGQNQILMMHEKLLWAYHNKNDAQKITKKAKSFIAKNYSIQAVGKIVEREIANI